MEEKKQMDLDILNKMKKFGSEHTLSNSVRKCKSV